MIRIPVAVHGRGYEVFVGPGVIGGAASLLPGLGPAEKAFVVADHEVASRYFARLAAALAERSIQAIHLPVARGERAKSLAVAEAMYRQLALQEAQRGDVIVALGGGITGDLAGFVAATYMRGVPFLQVPTTLTAQVDAAVGGKTGLNLPAGKNLVGAYHQPVAVLADVEALGTLDERDYRAGLAEVAKYGLSLDLPLLELLEGSRDAIFRREPAVLEIVVARCVRAKAELVVADERDEGVRMFLNYGHTLGHALERADSFAGRMHGEAVAVGMVFAARLSETLGLAGPGLAARHTRLLASLGLPTGGPLPDAERLLEAFRMDKKRRGGVRFVLLAELGRPRIVQDVPEAVVREVLESMGTGGS